MAEPVRHPEDGRWGVLVPDEKYHEWGTWSLLDRRRLVRPDGLRANEILEGPFDRTREVVAWLRGHEFDTNRPCEVISVPGGMAFFYLESPDAV